MPPARPRSRGPAGDAPTRGATRTTREPARRGRPAWSAERERFATHGQPAALAVVERMLVAGAPQALLLAGPASVGKTTLALDLAAGLLCHDQDAGRRPCGTCRSCRLIAAGEHQDLHRLVPEGPGRQVRIGDPRDPEPGSVRHLVHELARRPVEGAHRVAIIEEAHRLNEDAQNALLKTLEEPPAGVTLILCADEADRLLPTVRSRTAVLRLGPVGTRAIEELLADRGVDPPRGARLARLSGGRPGLALALAEAPEAVAAREELARSLLDLVAARDADRLAASRDLLARAGDVARAGGPLAESPFAGELETEVPADTRPARGATPAERRRAAAVLLSTWAAVTRDLAVVVAGRRDAVRDPAILDELDGLSSQLPAAIVTTFLARLGRAADLLDNNANPELLVDTLVLAWPRSTDSSGVPR